MISEIPESDWKLSKSLFTLRHHCSKTIVMDSRFGKSTVPSTMWETRNTTSNPMNEGMFRREMQYRPSFSQGNGNKKGLRKSYFGLESMFLLVCLTASLLILPLILPPLPPPPFLLLLVPIAILGLLVILAFMPSNVRDLTYRSSM